MRALVVGAEGFVGAALCHELRARGHEVRAVDIRPPGSRTAKLASELDWRIGDASRLEVLLDALQPPDIDAVYFGTFYRTDAPGANLEQEVEVMGSAVWRAMRVALAQGVSRFVFPSSIAVHGVQSDDDPDYDEDSPVRPYETYGVLKLMGEYVGARINASAGRNFAVSVRIPSVYGPGAAVASRFVNVPAVQAARGAVATVPYAAKARICVSHVTDTAGALASVLEATDVKRSVYELGGLDVSYGDIAAAVTETVPTADIRLGDELVLPFPHRVRSTHGRQEFGFAHRDLVSGMRSVIEYERERREAWLVGKDTHEAAG